MSKTRARILIVDDDQATCDTLEGLLFSEGYEVLIVNGGSDALRQVRAFKPDTILLDVIMEDMDGFEVCHKIKTEKKTRHIPIILVTGLDSKEDLSQGLDAGADDFVQKPVNGLELRARVRSMLRIKRQFDELEELLHLREDLSNMIMHDMKNPLAAIMMSTQLLQLKHNIPSDLKYIDTILTQSRRLESLMNDILVLAKMKAGKLVLNKISVDVNEFLKKVESQHLTIGESRSIKFVIELLEKPVEILIDINLFLRVMDNLISNAFKFSPNDSTITLKLENIESDAGSEFNHVRIKVMDEGHGIPEEHRNDVFDKFKVVAMKREGIPQFGLGLAFCKMVVEAHKGRISVESNVPTGSIFTVEL